MIARIQNKTDTIAYHGGDEVVCLQKLVYVLSIPCNTGKEGENHEIS